MSFERILQPIEEHIINLLLQSIPYLSPGLGGTCRGVADIETAKDYTGQRTPCAFVMAGAELDEDPRQISSGNQYARQYWRVMVMAESFTNEGDGRTDGHTTHGIYSMLDDVDGALRGRKGFPGIHPEWKLFKSGQTHATPEGQHLTAVSTWWHRVHRREQVGS